MSPHSNLLILMRQFCWKLYELTLLNTDFILFFSIYYYAYCWNFTWLLHVSFNHHSVNHDWDVNEYSSTRPSFGHTKHRLKFSQSITRNKVNQKYCLFFLNAAYECPTNVDSSFSFIDMIDPQIMLFSIPCFFFEAANN